MLRDEGAFVMEYLPAHVKAVEPIAAKVHQAIRDYQAAGIPIQHKVLVRLYGKGAAHADALYWPNSNPPLMVIAPKAYKDPILGKTIIHEFGHYMHDKVVPGGMNNPEIKRRYFWALKQKATGEGPKRDNLIKRIKLIELEMKKLEAERIVQKPLPKRGEIFDYTFRAFGNVGVLKVRILKKPSNKTVLLEVLEWPPNVEKTLSVYRRLDGHPLMEVDTMSLTFTGINPEVEPKIKALEAERHQLFEELKGVSRTEQDDRYESQRHEWAPTQYSRKNSHEWFAELCTTYVLGHLKKPVDEWLLSVIKTGEAPPGMALG